MLQAQVTTIKSCLLTPERRVSDQGNAEFCLYDTERRVKEFIDSGHFEEEDNKQIDVPFFDMESILAATNNFSLANKLGQGGFGLVYKVTTPFHTIICSLFN